MSTRADIVRIIQKSKGSQSIEEIAAIYKLLTDANHRFMNSTGRINNAMTAFRLGQLTTEKGVKVKIPHWTNSSQWKINGEVIWAAIHATSNAPLCLTNEQVKSVAMEALIKSNSPNPASIVTSGCYEFRSVKNDVKLIKSWQLHYVMYDVYRYDLSSDYINEFAARDEEIAQILGPEATRADIAEFSAGIHNFVLENDYNKNIQTLIAEIEDLIKHN